MSALFATCASPQHGSKPSVIRVRQAPSSAETFKWGANAALENARLQCPLAPIGLGAATFLDAVQPRTSF